MLCTIQTTLYQAPFVFGVLSPLMAPLVQWAVIVQQAWLSLLTRPLFVVSPMVSALGQWTTAAQQGWTAIWPRVIPGRPNQNGQFERLLKARTLYDRGRALLSRGETEAALSLAHAARDAFVGTDDREGLGLAEALVGDTLTHIGQYELAADAYQRATEAFRRPENDAKAFIELAKIQRQLGNHDQALKALEKAYALFKRLDDGPCLAFVSHQLAYTLYELERWQEAETAYRETLRLAEIQGVLDQMDSLLVEIGNTLAQQGRMAEAREFFEQSIDHARATDNDHTLADALHSLATTYAHDGEYETAIPIYQESLHLHLEHDNKIGLAYTLYEWGASEAARGRQAQAEWLFENAAHIFEQLGAPEGKIARFTLDSLQTQ